MSGTSKLASCSAWVRICRKFCAGLLSAEDVQCELLGLPRFRAATSLWKTVFHKRLPTARSDLWPLERLSPSVVGLLASSRTCAQTADHKIGTSAAVRGHFFSVTLPAPNARKESGCRLKNSNGRLEITLVTEIPFLTGR